MRFPYIQRRAFVSFLHHCSSSGSSYFVVVIVQEESNRSLGYVDSRRPCQVMTPNGVSMISVLVLALAAPAVLSLENALGSGVTGEQSLATDQKQPVLALSPSEPAKPSSEELRAERHQRDTGVGISAQPPKNVDNKDSKKSEVKPQAGGDAGGGHSTIFF